ncbi:MAG TPA: hypothetical protein PLM35_08570, partial [Cyclobacteriaceae bacterium]|nr:hypothetical protein [Cyclobacteriaceae bacterium]
VNFGGWIKKEIEENECGIHVDPRQPGDLIKKLEPFMSNRPLLERYQAHARSLAERKYSRKSLSVRFAHIITTAIPG